jgi:hypothetical protein
MFLVPTYCDPFTVAELEKKVFTENGNVYYWDIDPNQKEGNPLKKQAAVRLPETPTLSQNIQTKITAFISKTNF